MDASRPYMVMICGGFHHFIRSPAGQIVRELMATESRAHAITFSVSVTWWAGGQRVFWVTIVHSGMHWTTSDPNISERMRRRARIAE